MHKNYKLFTPIVLVLMGLSVVLTVITLFFNIWLFILCAVVSLLVLMVVYLLLARANKQVGENLKGLSQSILYANSDVVADSKVPTIVVYEGGEIIWYNDTCGSGVFDHEDYFGEHISRVFPTLDVQNPSGSAGVPLAYNDRQYTAFVTLGKRKNEETTVIYLIDDTQLKEESLELHDTRPSVALVLVDSYEELLQDYKDLERAQIMDAIEESITTYFESNNGFVVKTDRDRFMVVLQERGIRTIKEQKFDLLNRVRSLQLGDRMTATISIGIGHGAESLGKSKEMANQALEMCLGRGGDQAAIRGKDGYEFYGGVSSGVEKRTKVKTRIIASALAELIEASSNVIIMAHRFADLDALGSAVGMLKAVREMNKPSFICISEEKNLVGQMLDRLKANGYTDKDFRHPQLAMRSVNNGTLLIVVDVHVASVLESEEIYKSCRNVVVIDHHRKLVDYIKDAVIFYHEPFASSASEMVTELIQYFPVDPKIGKPEAEALLSGIALDTKNFVMRTGVRTFEAAAWLRRMGADTVEVKRMFTSSMENYRSKAGIVSRAVIYQNCAIAYAEEQFDGVRVVSSQAADDLMNISGVNASFVVFPFDGEINVSARSMGAVNVQVVMESLGGGGHQAMAAAQFKDETTEHIMEEVKKAIDSYYDSLTDDARAKMNLPKKETMNLADIVEEGTILEGQVLSEAKHFTDEL